MTQTPHPRLPMLTKEQGVAMAREKGVDAVHQWIRKREELIRLELDDRLRYGYVLDSWKLIEDCLKTVRVVHALGGNGSGKSMLGAWFGSKCLSERTSWERPSPQGEIYDVAFFHSSEQSSINQQQMLVRDYLPREWREIGKVGNDINVCYTRQNGFSGGRFILPNFARGLFFNFSQEVRVLVGYKLNLAVCDELITPQHLEEIRFRLWDRAGRLLCTYTPIDGFTPVVASALSGAEVVATREATLLEANVMHVPGCPRGHMPTIMRSRDGQQMIVFMHSDQNPYNNPEDLKRTLANFTTAQRKIRFYGYPERMSGTVFSKFNGKVHVVKHEDIPTGNDCTNYMVVDPGGAKNWFITWLRVDKLGRIFVYREYPTPDMGEWAVPAEKMGWHVPGPAQKADAGKGITGYKRLILDLEDGEEIMERLIDPRAGAAAVPGIDEGTSIIDLMAQEQVDRDNKVTGPAMSFIPAPATRTMQETGMDDGVSLVNDWLDYDDQKPVTILNAPRLYVSERCPNTIYALREWTGLDGQKGACKDPVDCLKYAAKRGLEYVAPGDLVVTGGFKQ